MMWQSSLHHYCSSATAVCVTAVYDIRSNMLGFVHIICKQPQHIIRHSHLTEPPRRLVLSVPGKISCQSTEQSCQACPKLGYCCRRGSDHPARHTARASRPEMLWKLNAKRCILGQGQVSFDVLRHDTICKYLTCYCCCELWWYQIRNLPAITAVILLSQRSWRQCTKDQTAKVKWYLVCDKWVIYR